MHGSSITTLDGSAVNSSAYMAWHENKCMFFVCRIGWVKGCHHSTCTTAVGMLTQAALTRCPVLLLRAAPLLAGLHTAPAASASCKAISSARGVVFLLHNSLSAGGWHTACRTSDSTCSIHTLQGSQQCKKRVVLLHSCLECWDLAHSLQDFKQHLQHPHPARQRAMQEACYLTALSKCWNMAHSFQERLLGTAQGSTSWVTSCMGRCWQYCIVFTTTHITYSTGASSLKTA